MEVFMAKDRQLCFYATRVLTLFFVFNFFRMIRPQNLDLKERQVVQNRMFVFCADVSLYFLAE